MSREDRFGTKILTEGTPESELRAFVVWKFNFSVVAGERDVVAIRFVILQLFYACVSVTVDVDVSHFPILYQSSV